MRFPASGRVKTSGQHFINVSIRRVPAQSDQVVRSTQQQLMHKKHALSNAVGREQLLIKEHNAPAAYC